MASSGCCTIFRTLWLWKGCPRVVQCQRDPLLHPDPPLLTLTYSRTSHQRMHTHAYAHANIINSTSYRLIRYFAPLVFFLTVHPALCSTIAAEESMGLKPLLRIMGMRESAYWSSTQLWDALVVPPHRCITKGLTPQFCRHSRYHRCPPQPESP